MDRIKKPRFFRYAKISNRVVAFSAINTDIPTPMIRERV